MIQTDRAADAIRFLSERCAEVLKRPELSSLIRRVLRVLHRVEHQMELAINLRRELLDAIASGQP